MHFDVIVIGSGPAASTAAIGCLQFGLNTLIVTDKEQNPSCSEDEIQPSESIHTGVYSVLTQLDALNSITTAVQGIYKGIETNGQLNLLGEDKEDWEGYHLNRMRFNHGFFQSAIEQGAVVRYKDAVAIILSDEVRVLGVTTKSGLTITASFIIDASGHQRIGGRQLRLKEELNSPPLITWTGVSQIPEDTFPFKKDYAHFIPHPEGWTWLAPEYHDRCTWTRLSIKGNQKFLPPQELANYPLLSPIRVSNRRWRVFRPVCKEGILLCGDAAGILDPAAGQGILNAIISAIIATKIIKACCLNPGFEAFYLARYDDWFITVYREKLSRLKHLYEINGINLHA
jgi:flavin-dependent dehydrogenase